MVANFIKNHLEEAVSEFKPHADNGTMSKFLKTKCHELSTKLSESGIDTYMSGTTIVLALILGTQVHVANIGDSKIYLAVEKQPHAKLIIEQLSTLSQII